MDIDTNEIDRRFDHHVPDEDRQRAHEAMRREFKALASGVAAALPAGREKSLAITALEEALFWANAAIARQ